MNERPSPVKIRALPADSRPRERAERLGVASLGTEELLAILLRSGPRGRSVLEVAQDLLNRHGRRLAGLARAPLAELRGIPGVGRVRAIELAAAFELGFRLAREEGARRRPGPLDSPEKVQDLLAERAARLDQEEFWVIPLNQKHVPLCDPVAVTRGTLNQSLVHAREVFRVAIGHAAAAVIVAHNHPSGDPAPSRADFEVTRRLAEAGRVVGIELLDHVIVGGNSREARFVSMRREGHLGAEGGGA